MIQVKMFRSKNRSAIESSINGFLKENKIKNVIDLKMMMVPISMNDKIGDYVGTLIYEIED